MYQNEKLSIILPTYNEADSIRKCIEDFESLDIVDEIIVVNNNAAPGTSEEVAKTSAMEIHEPRQGYGYSMRRGLAEASGDILVVCEPDDTFVAADLAKFLAYMDLNVIVFGSRTVQEFIWRGANMGLFLRWGNYAVAKLLEFLFNTNQLTDVGCTFRLIHRRAYEAMRPHFTVGDNHFGLEMMLIATRLRLRYVQIPINYRRRVGESSVTGNSLQAFFLGMTMIRTIFAHRFGLIELRGEGR